MRSIRTKLILSALLIILIGATISGSLVLRRYIKFLNSSIRERLLLAVETAAVSYDFTQVKNLFKDGGESSSYHLNGVDKIIELKKITGVAYLYGLVKSPEGEWVYIFDDSYYDLKAGGEDAFLYPLDGEWESLEIAVETGKPQIDKEYETDEWGTFLSIVKPITDSGGNFIMAIGADIEATDIEKQKFRTVLILIIAVILSTIVSLLVASFLSAIFIKPVTNMVNSLEEISSGDGDLTRRLEMHSRDQIGQMTQLYNKFLDSLSHLVKKVKISVKENMEIKNIVNSSSADAGLSSDVLSLKIESTYDNIKKLDNSITESSQSLRLITGKIQELRLLIDEQSVVADDSTTSITQMVESLNTIASIVSRKEKDAQNLVQRSRDGKLMLKNTSDEFQDKIADKISSISNMTKVIAKIARETNLLSMNAAIEAAHAGEYGTGFAVVAEEIRSLAEDAGKNSMEISETIKGIIRAIEETGEHFTTTSASFNQIENEVMEVDSALKEINSATDKLSSGGDKIVEAMAVLNSSAKTLHNNSREMETLVGIGEEADEYSRSLCSEVVKLMNESAEQNKKVKEDIKTAIEATESLNKISEEINKQMNMFKTE